MRSEVCVGQNDSRPILAKINVEEVEVVNTVLNTSRSGFI